MTHLTFNTNIDIIPFLDMVKCCKGEVELRTPMGDVLNLQSELSRYLLITVLTKPELLAGAEIYCSEEDAGILQLFLTEEQRK